MCVCVCVVMQGAVLSSQVFDTYLQGGESKMADFIKSVSNGRILCFAIKVSLAMCERRGGGGGGGSCMLYISTTPFSA